MNDDVFQAAIKIFQGRENIWIGINDLQIEGRWVYASNNETVTFNRWFPGNPDGGEQENCGQMMGSFEGTWGTWKCNQSSGMHSICQLEFS